MADRIPIDPDAEKNNSAAAVPVTGSVPRDQASAPAADQLDIHDKTTIDKDIPPAPDEKVNPQIDFDFDNVDKALLMSARPATPNTNRFFVNKLCEGFDNVLNEVESLPAIPEKLKIKIDTTAAHFLQLSKKYKAHIDTRLEGITVKKANKEGDEELNELSEILARLYRIEEKLKSRAHIFGLTSSTVAMIDLNIDESRKLEEKVIHIATLKGYSLQDIDDAARAAEEESDGYSFTVYDNDQEKLLSAMKQQANQLLTEIRAFCREDFSRQLTLDRTSAMRKLSEKKHDLAIFEQEYVKKLHEKKLRDKMKAEIIVLAYLLKNPASLTLKRVSEITDEINKIKWQTFPRFT